MSKKSRSIPGKVAVVFFNEKHDLRYKYLLEAWDENEDFEFVFSDDLIRSNEPRNSISAIPFFVNVLQKTGCILTIIGENGYTFSQEYAPEGFRNWIEFAITTGKTLNKRILAVHTDPAYQLPAELLQTDIQWIPKFEYTNVIHAVKAALSYTEGTQAPL